MDESDGGEVVVKDCNEGRFRLWNLLDFHTYRVDDVYVHPNSWGDRTVTEKCRVCGAKRQYDLPGGP